MTYLWQKPEWPSFSWSSSALLELLVKARFEQGRLLSLESSFVHSFEISEIKRALYEDLISVGDLSQERLAGWQASLFPTGFSGVKKIKIAELRTAEVKNKDLLGSSLPQKNLQEELDKYLHWWKEPPVELDPVIRSGLAFFWFLIVSPYEDGNFDLASALSELALQENEKTATRLYDMSFQLAENKADVLQKVEKIARGSGDITEWILFYLGQYIAAVTAAFTIADKIQKSEKFWKKFSAFDLNMRQRKILNLMLEENQQMNNRSYVELCNTSRESAKRDLAELVKFGILKTGDKKGRSIIYFL